MSELLFRLDAGPGIGSGHLTRCLALAAALAESGSRAHLALSNAVAMPSAWRQHFTSIHILGQPAGTQADLKATVLLAERLQADWVVVDHYGFDVTLIDALAGARRTLLIDDLGERDTAAALVLNPNVGAEARCRSAYGRAREILLGADYFLLRPILAAVERRPEARRVLISLGADDPDNLVLACVRALIAAAVHASFDVVTTASETGQLELRAVLEQAPGDWRVHPGPLELAPLMARAEVLLCGGGATAGEAAALGLPAILVVRADNQSPGAQALVAAGAALLAGDGAAAIPKAARLLRDLLENATLREDMARAGRSLIDGGGARRVTTRMFREGNQR